MSERMLISKIKRTNETRADLIAKGHKYRDIICFDLAELADAGIDYENLPVGQEVPCRFWAYYVESDKRTSQGSPYLDLVTVEPIDRPASATSVDTSALLDELRQIRVLLERLLSSQGLMPDVLKTGPDLPRTQARAGLSSDEPSPEDPPEPPPEAMPEEPPPTNGHEEPDGPAFNDDQARRQFSKLASPAIREGKVAPEAVNELVKDASVRGWGDALRQLKAALQQAA